MTDKKSIPSDAETLNVNLERIETLSQRLVAALARQKDKNNALEGPGHELYTKAAAAYFSEMMSNPSKILEQQVAYWGQSLKHLVEAQENVASGALVPQDSASMDRRFKNEMWQSNPYFHFIKQQYLMSSQAIEKAVDGLEGLPGADRARVNFFSRQIVDLMSPTNFLGSNPEALARAVETNGQSLVDGLENLVRDVEANDGSLAVTLADPNAFEVGKNIASTPGSVVFQNRMFQLIQYAPTTTKVHRTPLIIFPPWINKFYILDLKEKNSFIRWAVAQGYTVFVVSWINPDATYVDVGIDTYISEGFLTAIDEVKKITGEEKVNAIGYCIAGTMLSATLAYMAKTGDKSIRSATFFTTLADFSDPGETGVFLAGDFLDGISREVEEKGFLHAFFMQRTFSYLRANDLVYTPAIRSYMMGEAPPAFDLLYWNGDGTNLSGRLVTEYLKHFCVENELSEGTFEVLGERLSLAKITTPICAVACETDHIAKWQGSFLGLNKFGGDKTFILSESGHVAGIVNPPNRKKYGHYTNADKMVTPESWKKQAAFSEGSWWPRWDGWLKRRAGAMIAARVPGEGGRCIVEPAPGSYVRTKPAD